MKIKTVFARLECDELLDQGAGSPDDVRQNFDEMWRINRYLGGILPLTQHLFPRLMQEENPVSVVDIGTGAGQMLLTLVHWSSQHQHPISPVGLDVAARHLHIAQENTPNIPFLQANALNLPFGENSIDYFISSLFLHHLSPDQIIDLLRDSFAKVRKALIFSDLVRGWLPLIAFRCIQPVFARNFLTQHDGAVSVRRAYTPDELLMLAQMAGLTHARVFRHFPWRMTLVVEKNHHDL